jgi:pimeloyl-ACP methyl ester carboxylesterase
MRRRAEQRVTARVIGGFTLCACMAVALGCSARRAYDPVGMDPPLTEADRAQGHRATVEFESGGVTLEGVLYQAPGSGPHPTVVYLHGYPGGPAGFDLAMALRRAGWNVLMFHYRGSWASAGSFSVRNGLEDVQAAVRHLRSEENARNYRVDPKRIALVGHSAGAWYALMAAAADPEIEAVVSIAAVNVGAVGRELAGIDFEDAARMMAPPRGIAGVTGEQLAREFIENADAFDLTTKVEALAQRSVMLVAGERDSVAPPEKYHWPLVHALQAKGAKRLAHLVLDDDHHFLDSRIALARAITRWLGEQTSGTTQ